MPIDPRIPLMGAQVQVPDPMKGMQQILGLRDLMEQRRERQTRMRRQEELAPLIMRQQTAQTETAEMDVTKQKQTQANVQLLKDLWKKNLDPETGSLNQEGLLKDLGKNGLGEAASKLRNLFSTEKIEAANQTTAEWGATAAQAEERGRAAGVFTAKPSQPSLDNYRQVLKRLKQPTEHLPEVFDPADKATIEIAGLDQLGSMSTADLYKNLLKKEEPTAEGASKELKLIAQTMGAATSGADWAARHQYLSQSPAISPETMQLVPKQYSPEAARKMAQLGEEPSPSRLRTSEEEASDIRVAQGSRPPERGQIIQTDQGFMVAQPGSATAEPLMAGGKPVMPSPKVIPTTVKNDFAVLDATDKLLDVIGKKAELNPGWVRGGILPLSKWSGRLQEKQGSLSKAELLFRKEVKGNLVEQIHQLSGAAVSSTEAERLIQALPDFDAMSSPEFVQAVKASRNWLRMKRQQLEAQFGAAGQSPATTREQPPRPKNVPEEAIWDEQTENWVLE